MRALSKSKQRGKLVNKKVLSAIASAFLKATLLQWEGVNESFTEQRRQFRSSLVTFI